MVRGRWRRRVVRFVIVLYLFVQIGVPAGSLYLAHSNDRGYPFSWHMFSRMIHDD